MIYLCNNCKYNNRNICCNLVSQKIPYCFQICHNKTVRFQPIKRTLIVVAITGVIGYFYYIVQYSISLDTIILLNVFAQTLPTFIAEVVICWVILGIAFESFIQPDGRRGRGRRITSIIIGAIVATILFQSISFCT